MRKKQELIKDAEAVKLFDFAMLGDVYRARELYNLWLKTQEAKDEKENKYIFSSALGFVYCTGRIQGIKDERAKKNKL